MREKDLIVLTVRKHHLERNTIPPRGVTRIVGYISACPCPAYTTQLLTAA
jgi:hypothetical protein